MNAHAGLTFAPLSARIGVAVSGVDFAWPLGTEVADSLRALLDEYGLLLFRTVDVGSDAQVALLAHFGPVCSEFGDGRYFTQMATVDAQTDWTIYRLPYHQDGANTQHQHVINSLYAVELDPEVAVPTYFSSCRGAAADLTEEEGAYLSGLHAVHVVRLDSRMLDGGNTRVRLDLLPDMPPEATHPRTTHPVLKLHPRTGEKLLFITELQTSHIEGVGAEESERVIQLAHRLLYTPDNSYIHRWQEGDLLIWDNFTLQHARARPVPGSRRTLRRVIVNPVQGSVPVTKGQMGATAAQSA